MAAHVRRCDDGGHGKSWTEGGAMMYGAEQVREPRSLGRRMSDSVIAAVCTGLMAVLCIGMLWAMSHVGQ